MPHVHYLITVHIHTVNTVHEKRPLLRIKSLVVVLSIFENARQKDIKAQTNAVDYVYFLKGK